MKVEEVQVAARAKGVSSEALSALASLSGEHRAEVVKFEDDAIVVKFHSLRGAVRSVVLAREGAELWFILVNHTKTPSAPKEFAPHVNTSLPRYHGIHRAALDGQYTRRPADAVDGLFEEVPAELTAAFDKRPRGRGRLVLGTMPVTGKGWS